MIEPGEITQRLRDPWLCHFDPAVVALGKDAADEIERLRAALKAVVVAYWKDDDDKPLEALAGAIQDAEALVNEQTTRREAIGKMVAEAQKLDLP